MATQTEPQMRTPGAATGWAVFLVVLAVVLVALTTVGGVAFLAPIPVVVLGIPAWALIRRGRHKEVPAAKVEDKKTDVHRIA